MKSSEDLPREADMAGERVASTAPPISRDEVRAMMPSESIWKYRIRQIDFPAQLGRIALVLLVWWL